MESHSAPPGYNPNVSMLQGGTTPILPVQGGGGVGVPPTPDYNADKSLLEGGTGTIQAVKGGGPLHKGGNPQLIENYDLEKYKITDSTHVIPTAEEIVEILNDKTMKGKRRPMYEAVASKEGIPNMIKISEGAPPMLKPVDHGLYKDCGAVKSPSFFETLHKVVRISEEKNPFLWLAVNIQGDLKKFFKVKELFESANTPEAKVNHFLFFVGQFFSSSRQKSNIILYDEFIRLKRDHPRQVFGLFKIDQNLLNNACDIYKSQFVDMRGKENRRLDVFLEPDIVIFPQKKIVLRNGPLPVPADKNGLNKILATVRKIKKSYFLLENGTEKERLKDYFDISSDTNEPGTTLPSLSELECDKCPDFQKGFLLNTFKKRHLNLVEPGLYLINNGEDPKKVPYLQVVPGEEKVTVEEEEEGEAETEAEGEEEQEQETIVPPPPGPPALPVKPTPQAERIEEPEKAAGAFKASPEAYQSDTSTDFQIDYMDFTIRNPTKSNQVKEDWLKGTFTEGEVELLNGLKLSPQALEDIFKDKWKEELATFLESLTISSCFKNTKYLLTSECDQARRFLRKVYYNTYVDALNKLYAQWGIQGPPPDSTEILEALLKEIGQFMIMLGKDREGMSAAETKNITAEEFLGDPSGRYLKILVDLKNEETPFFANYAELEEGSETEIQQLENKLKEIRGKIKSYKRITGKNLKSILNAYKKTRKGKKAPTKENTGTQTNNAAALLKLQEEEAAVAAALKAKQEANAAASATTDTTTTGTATTGTATTGTATTGTATTGTATDVNVVINNNITDEELASRAAKEAELKAKEEANAATAATTQANTHNYTKNKVKEMDKTYPISKFEKPIAVPVGGWAFYYALMKQLSEPPRYEFLTADQIKKSKNPTPQAAQELLEAIKQWLQERVATESYRTWFSDFNIFLTNPGGKELKETYGFEDYKSYVDLLDNIDKQIPFFGSYGVGQAAANILETNIYVLGKQSKTTYEEKFMFKPKEPSTKSLYVLYEDDTKYSVLIEKAADAIAKAKEALVKAPNSKNVRLPKGVLQTLRNTLRSVGKGTRKANKKNGTYFEANMENIAEEFRNVNAVLANAAKKPNVNVNISRNKLEKIVAVAEANVTNMAALNIQQNAEVVATASTTQENTHNYTKNVIIPVRSETEDKSKFEPMIDLPDNDPWSFYRALKIQVGAAPAFNHLSNKLIKESSIPTDEETKPLITAIKEWIQSKANTDKKLYDFLAREPKMSRALVRNYKTYESYLDVLDREDKKVAPFLAFNNGTLQAAANILKANIQIFREKFQNKEKYELGERYLPKDKTDKTIYLFIIHDDHVNVLLEKPVVAEATANIPIAQANIPIAEANVVEDEIVPKSHFEVVPVPADGWCFYHALLKQVGDPPEYKSLTKNEIKEKKVSREATLPFVQAIKAWLKDRVKKNPQEKELYETIYDPHTYNDKNLEKYELKSLNAYINGLNRIEGPRVWADVTAGVGDAAADILKSNILVYDTNDENTYKLRIKVPYEGEGAETARTLYLLYINGNHFDVLLKKERNNNTQIASNSGSLVPNKKNKGLEALPPNVSNANLNAARKLRNAQLKAREQAGQASDERFPGRNPLFYKNKTRKANKKETRANKKRKEKIIVQKGIKPNNVIKKQITAYKKPVNPLTQTRKRGKKTRKN